MAQNFQFRDPIPFPAKKVLEKMLEPEFNRIWTIEQRGMNPVVTVKEKTADKFVMDIELEEPLPKPLGTMKAKMHFTWDLKAMKMTWTREGMDSMSKTSRINGETRLESRGADACDLVEIINIDVPVPLLGKKIEKGVADYLKESRPSKIAFLLKHLK